MYSYITEKLGIEVIDNNDKTADEIVQDYLPTMWVDKEKKIIDENVFAQAFRDANKLQYSNGLFYTNIGKKTDETILKDIWESISDVGINVNVEQKTKRLLGAVKLASTVEKLKPNENIIPFSNGDLHLDTMIFNIGSFSPQPYRLKSPLMVQEKLTTPNFDKWLNDLFSAEDIPTIQEFLGYCLIPTTKAQKSLFLVGEGGAGKSVIGVILEAMLGEAMLSTPNTQEFMTDKFKLPELENKLVLYDDDLDAQALSATGLYKKLITNNLAITADRKYGQPFKFTPFVKLVSCCNEMLSSVYDQTNGFYRRLLPILIKPIAKDFVPDPLFYDKIRSEIRGIIHWSLEGLLRLKSNNFILTESERSKSYLGNKKSIGNHFPDFIQECFDFNPLYRCTSKSLLDVYTRWCDKNAVEPRKARAVYTYLADNLEQLGIEKSTHIPDGNVRVNGYKGLTIKSAWQPQQPITSDGKIHF